MRRNWVVPYCAGILLGHGLLGLAGFGIITVDGYYQMIPPAMLRGGLGQAVLMYDGNPLG